MFINQSAQDMLIEDRDQEKKERSKSREGPRKLMRGFKKKVKKRRNARYANANTNDDIMDDQLGTNPFDDLLDVKSS